MARQEQLLRAAGTRSLLPLGGADGDEPINYRNGRPPVDDTVVALIERMARENTTWGYRRIQGEPLKLDHRVAASTVHRVRKRLRVPPGGQRLLDVVAEPGGHLTTGVRLVFPHHYAPVRERELVSSPVVPEEEQPVERRVEVREVRARPEVGVRLRDPVERPHDVDQVLPLHAVRFEEQRAQIVGQWLTE